MQIPKARQIFTLLCLFCCGIGTRPIFGVETSLSSVADTFLSENYPSNNMGGNMFFNAGTTQNVTKNRGLLKFNPAAQLPAGSKIITANLILEVVAIPNVPPPSANFDLHLVLKDWGEGSKTSPTNCNSCSGQGAAATTNEATWFCRFAFTTNTWTAPGADATNDYAVAVSSSQTIYGVGDSPYTFASTTQMVADVQLWLDNPQTNFGWILITEDESLPFSARRFASREDTNRAPQLVVGYVVPPGIDRVELSGNQFRLFFTAEAGQTYAVQYSDVLAPTNNWSTLTNISAPAETTSLVITDFTSVGQRFYRLGTQ
jgi:hypothetical protein